MKGGICNRAMSNPLTRPGMIATAVPERIAASIAANGGRPNRAAKKFDACAAATDESPMTKPTERFDARGDNDEGLPERQQERRGGEPVSPSPETTAGLMDWVVDGDGPKRTQRACGVWE